MRPDARLLPSFVALADELHFGRAAARLDLTQPALSQQIKRLELQLGVELFARTRNSVALTAAGEAALPHARAAVEAAASAVDAARAVAHRVSGQLRLRHSPRPHHLSPAPPHPLAPEPPRLRLRPPPAS